MTAQNLLWCAAGVAVAYVWIGRRRARERRRAELAATVAPHVDAGADDGPEAELLAERPCCSECAEAAAAPTSSPAAPDPVAPLLPPASSPRTVRIPRGPIRIYTGGGVSRPRSLTGASISLRPGYSIT